MQTSETTKQIGNFGERIAVRYLRLHGYTVKERNWRSGHMEIDIIAANFKTLAFVEVKTRTYTKETIHEAPPPSSAVKSEKQRLTRRAAKDYLWQHPTKKSPRMDVIEVWLIRDETTDKTKVAKINHIKAAY
ncbi:MAG: YraN family protein [Ruminococcaceae bacterium]|nr:YraN family protein [Oscillospiraceae bacterium]